MKDLISIIIPVYNLEKFISRCLDSVVNQTYKNIEIIIINDGSVDGTGKIIDEYAKKDQRIKVIHKNNTGVSDSRNKGMEIATGNYIGFVDGDDELYPDMYELLIKNIKKYKADISHCGFELVTPKATIKFHGTEKIYLQNTKEALTSLMRGKIFEPSTWNKLFKEKILKDVRYNENIKVNEDLLFNISAFKKAEKIIFADIVKYRYIDNSADKSNDYRVENLEDVILVAQIAKNMLQKMGLDNETNRLYVGKVLNVYKLYKTRNLFDTSKAKRIKKLLKDSSNKGLNMSILFNKYTLLYFPGLYDFVRYIYDATLAKRQKWNLMK